jgi:hypothetical protein
MASLNNIRISQYTYEKSIATPLEEVSGVEIPQTAAPVIEELPPQHVTIKMKR